MSLNYWNSRWEKKETGWDIGYASPAIVNYLNLIENKNIAILIPGCGNAYEAEYLVENGFSNITLIDIAPLAVDNLKRKFAGNENIKILCEDFFEHQGKYDLVIEQTFFCAISTEKRQMYVEKMHNVLNENGKIVGLLFNKQFNNPFPPFGGSVVEYKELFTPFFDINVMEACNSSILPRKGNELFICFQKK